MPHAASTPQAFNMEIQIDLKRNPQVADLIADMDMGSAVSFVTTLKSKSPELAEFTLERAEECEMPDNEENEEGEEGKSDEEAETDGDMMKKHAKMPAAGGSRNTPGGSVDQDRMAASMTAQI